MKRKGSESACARQLKETGDRQQGFACQGPPGVRSHAKNYP